MAIDIVEGLKAIAETRSADGNSPPPVSFNIKECQLQHGDDKIYDISRLVMEIHLFEDIEQLGISGWLKIRDNINLIRNALIIGEELLWLDFETAGATEAGLRNWSVRGYPLYIHKVEEIISPESNQGQTTQSHLEYRLHFCSTEMVTNDRMRLSKTFQGTIGSDKTAGGDDGIVADIMKKDMKIAKPVYCARTVGLKHFVTPNMHPFDLITFLANSAQSYTGDDVRGPQESISMNMFKNQHSDFVIFETSQRYSTEDGGWFMVPLQREMSSDNLIFTLNNAMTTSGTSETSAGGAGLTGYTAAMLRSKSFEYVTTGDKWKSVRAGAWAAKQIRHNSVHKSFKTYKSDYLKQLKKDEYSHASETPVWFNAGDGSKKISEWPNANVGFNSFSAGDMTNINQNTWRSDTPWGVGTPDHGLLRKMQMNHMLGYERIQCEMFGISGLQIGKNALAEFPQIGLGSGSPDQTGLAGSKDIWGEDRNNNIWMITKVAHHIICSGDDPNYTCTMELANTMRNTKKKLPVYGSLGGYGSGKFGLL